MTAHDIITQYQAGNITESECIAQLDRLEIRGGFDDNRNFTGYDYSRQTWIESNYGITVTEAR